MYTPILFILTIYIHFTSALILPWSTQRNKCRPQSQTSPPLTPTSCTTALRILLHKYPEPNYDFTTPFFPTKNTIQLPISVTYGDCTIRISLFYVFRVRESMSRIVAAVDEIIEDCVGGRMFSGGNREVGGSGLWVDVLGGSGRREQMGS